MKIPVFLTVEEIQQWIVICAMASVYCARQKMASMTQAELAIHWQENRDIVEAWQKRMEDMIGVR